MAESMSTMSDDDDDVVVESISSIDAVFFTIIEDERTDFLVDFLRRSERSRRCRGSKLSGRERKHF